MNLWARYDEEDRDYIHFSARYSSAPKSRRLICSVHIDDLPLLFGIEEARELMARLDDEEPVFCTCSVRVSE